MPRSLRHKSRRSPCQFLEKDEAGHWQCRLIQFSRQPMAIVTSQGHIEWATASARNLLHQYWPAATDLEDHLPNQIQRWLARHSKRTRIGNALDEQLPPLVINRPSARLTLRCMPDGEFAAVLLEEQLFELPAERIAALGLTPRETEVFQWIAQGKTSSEIATILGISARTVSKHLERIYRRLGVEHRHAALAMVWDAVLASASKNHADQQRAASRPSRRVKPV